MKDNKTSRRDFILNTGKIIGAGAFVATIPQLFNSCEKNEIIEIPPPELFKLDLTPYPELLTAGGCKSVKIEGKNAGAAIFIAHHLNGSWSAMTTVCAHQGCGLIAPANSNGTLDCPCHAGNTFSTVDGVGISGGFVGNGKMSLTTFKVGIFDSNAKTLELEI
ncbi:MAG: hypothetical protein A2X64_09495 [Ignavibacteria bacterium GWF2_33_9]|nr:MAG: hypothetical protein A2X64_09495 [Ignavibacteria bacterium GWF2_33_9]